MILAAAPAEALVARMVTRAPFDGARPSELLAAARAARILTLRPAELFAEKGAVPPGFCLALAGQLEWADTGRCLPWIHPARVAASDALPAAVRAGAQGAECLYVPTTPFLDLIERCPAFATAMVVAAETEGIWR
jgi:hypothetical protein